MAAIIPGNTVVNAAGVVAIRAIFDIITAIEEPEVFASGYEKFRES